MKILVCGEERRLAEWRGMMPENAHQVDYFSPEEAPMPGEADDYDLYVDLNLDDEPTRLELYAHLQGKPLLASAVKTQLAQMVYDIDMEPACILIGINALPTLLSRSKKEISLLRKEDAPHAAALMQALGWDFHIVEDRVGMVSPRIIFMIINEAAYTLQEGTATASDIDESMKLGTNYPFGPFEWAERIGIRDVFETLEALQFDTKDERYKICPLLKTRYLRTEVK